MFKKSLKPVLAAAICAAMTLGSYALDTVTPTSDLNVIHDSGNGDAYAQLEANYVQIGELDLTEAEISGDGYHLMTGQPGNGCKTNVPLLYYETTYKDLNWGTNHTTTSNASPALTRLPMVTLRFSNAASLSDGKKADVVITDTPSLYLGKNMNSSIGGSDKLKIAIMDYERKLLGLILTAPKKDLDKWDYDASTTGKNKSTGAATGRHDAVHMYIYKHGTTEPVSSSDYPSMLLVFKDLDAQDNMIATQKSYEERWNGRFAEGITLGSGWANPVVLAPDKGSSESITKRCLVDIQTTSTGNIKIKSDGRKKELLEANGLSINDQETYYTGFAAAVSPQDVYFGWDGSVNNGNTVNGCLGTFIGTQPTVDVRAKRSAGGSLRGSLLNSWGSTTHLMNSSADYAYKPDKGYTVEYLKVDGAEVSLTDSQKKNGGVYTFTRLNKYPVEVKDDQGNVLGAAESSYYTIEVKYAKTVEYGSLKITKNVTGNLGDITKEFEFTVSLSNLTPGMTGEIVNKGATLAGGFEGSSYKAGADGKATLRFRLEDEDAITLKGLPLGTSFQITEAKSDHNPSYTVTKGTAKIASGSQNKNTALSTSALTISESADYTAAFVNSRNLLPPTGNTERNIPLSLPAAACMAACVLACILACIFAALIRDRRRF